MWICGNNIAQESHNIKATTKNQKQLKWASPWPKLQDQCYSPTMIFKALNSKEKGL